MKTDRRQRVAKSFDDAGELRLAIAVAIEQNQAFIAAAQVALTEWHTYYLAKASGRVRALDLLWAKMESAVIRAGKLERTLKRSRHLVRSLAAQLDARRQGFDLTCFGGNA